MGEMADYYADLALQYEDEIRENEMQDYLKSDYLIIRNDLEWETNNGVSILVKEMTDTHVKNCIKYLEKHSKNNEWINVFRKELGIRQI